MSRGPKCPFISAISNLGTLEPAGEAEQGLRNEIDAQQDDAEGSPFGQEGEVEESPARAGGYLPQQDWNWAPEAKNKEDTKSMEHNPFINLDKIASIDTGPFLFEDK